MSLNKKEFDEQVVHEEAILLLETKNKFKNYQKKEKENNVLLNYS